MMEPTNQLNVKVLLAALVWSTVLNIGKRMAVSFFAKVFPSPFWQVSSILISILILMLYPILLAVISRRQTSLWRNVLCYAMLGSFLSFLVLDLIISLYEGLWYEAGLQVFVILLLFGAVLPRLNRVPSLVQERESQSLPWNRLNSLSWLHLVFLQIPCLKD
jgi:hypothetical protein